MTQEVPNLFLGQSHSPPHSPSDSGELSVPIQETSHSVLSGAAGQEAGYMQYKNRVDTGDELDEHNMRAAEIVAKKSPDQNTKVGTVIVAQDKIRVLGSGCNRMPTGLEGQFPWDRYGNNTVDTKYPFVVHSARNAIRNAWRNGAKLDDLKGTIMYTTLFPDNECAQEIIEVGIAEVVYLSDKYHDQDYTTASRMLLDAAGVKYRPLRTPCV